MSIKYLTAEQLTKLNDHELDEYARLMMEEQINILDAIDVWTDYYNLTSDEYTKRKTKKSIVFNNNSDTLH